MIIIWSLFVDYNKWIAGGTKLFLFFNFFFDKIKTMFIHSNRWITSFSTAKNVKDESVNKLTASKLIAYNGVMPTKIYDKIKVTRIPMPPDLQRWCSNLWLNNWYFNMNQMNTAAKRKIKQCRTRRRTTHHHTQMAKSRRKNLDLCENHLFKSK